MTQLFTLRTCPSTTSRTQMQRRPLHRQRKRRFLDITACITSRQTRMSKHWRQRRRQENSSGWQALAWGGDPAPVPSLLVPPLLLSLFLPFPTVPSLPSPLVPSPLRSRPPKIPLGALGERCKLPQRCLGRSSSRQTIWCILVLKSDIWWQQF